MHELHKKFEPLLGKYDNDTVFNDFMDYSLAFVEMDSETRIPIMKELKEKYGDELYLLHEIFDCWVNRTSYYLNEENKPYYDLIGKYYEELVTSSSKKTELGQYFSPHSVVGLMSELVIDNEGDTIYDAAGGSGRMLLASHIRNPTAICVSHDLDNQAVRMCALNMFVHGVRAIIIQMDSLTREFFTAYKVNEYCTLYGIEGMGVEQVGSLHEAYVFAGFNPKKVTHVPSKETPAGDKQSTLMEF